MTADRYTARIAATVIASDASYAALLRSLVRFTVEAAVARAADRYEWEHEELRRNGLQAVAVARNGRAIWRNREEYELEREEACREATEAAFDASNELDLEFCPRLEADLQARWRQAGYDVDGLRLEMKPLFAELESDAADRAAHAREGLVAEIVDAIDR